MSSLINNHFKGKACTGAIDLDTDDIRVALLKTTTTADTEPNVTLLSSYTGLAELSNASYTGQKNTGRHAFTSEAVNVDTGNNRAEFDGENITWTALDGGEVIQGSLLYKHVGADNANLPIAFAEFTSNITTDGSDVVIAWDAQGILQLA